MTQRTLFPLLLVGLPVGLAISVVAALYLYYNPLDIPLPSRPKRADAIAMLRRSPGEKDLLDYQRLLTTDLAGRGAGQPARQRAAANWIASTLGPSNLGLAVRMVDSEMAATGEAETGSGPLVPTIIAEVPGTRQRNEALLVVTGYHDDIPDLNSALSTASLMTVAGAFAGTPQRRTVIFAFLGGESPSLQGEPPLDALVKSLRLRDVTVRGVLDLRTAAAPPAAPADHTAPRARASVLAPRDGQAWTGEMREAFAPRKPEGLPVEFPPAADAPPAAAALAGWRAAPAPYLLLWLQPAAANDQAAPLALARSLEGVLQALANQ